MFDFKELVEYHSNLHDTQTSGGLLISVKASQASQLFSALKDAGISDAAQIGEVFDGLEEKILIE